jgi:hypothetical protein
MRQIFKKFHVLENNKRNSFIFYTLIITLLGIIIGQYMIPLIHAQVNGINQSRISNFVNTNVTNTGANNFQMSGPLSSFIATKPSDWIVGGNWSMKVQNGNLTNFDARMKWDPTNLTAPNTKSHIHTFTSFRADPAKNIVLGPKNTTQINGVMDVGLGLNLRNWKDVPAQINTAGSTIKISLNDSKTDKHFNNYPVYGDITNFVKLPSANTFDSSKNIPPPTNKNKSLDIKIEFDKNPIQRGGKQKLTIISSDSISNKTLAGLHLSGAIIPPSETNAINQTKSFKQDLTLLKLKNVNTFNGTTDSNGQLSYTWNLKKNFKPGTFTALIKANGLGYEEIAKSSTFNENKK